MYSMNMTEMCDSLQRLDRQINQLIAKIWLVYI